ncbi:MAG: DUF4242 domain-containing protein [Chloroflexota bacterium]
MDIHDILGVKSDDVAKAHECDLRVQGKYGVNYAARWVDEADGKCVRLVDAPDRESAARTIARRTASRRTPLRGQRRPVGPDLRPGRRHTCGDGSPGPQPAGVTARLPAGAIEDAGERGGSGAKTRQATSKPSLDGVGSQFAAWAASAGRVGPSSRSTEPSAFVVSAAWLRTRSGRADLPRARRGGRRR